MFTAVASQGTNVTARECGSSINPHRGKVRLLKMLQLKYDLTPDLRVGYWGRDQKHAQLARDRLREREREREKPPKVRGPRTAHRVRYRY